MHVVGPQLGLTQPGMTVVCGDSHTSTHGAFGALAFGIGTSEVEHVLATQTLPLEPFKTMAVTVDGTLAPGVTAKDVILAVIAEIGTGGGQGYVIEYRGAAIRGAVDGGPDDDLQHVDRGRCPGGHDRAGRDDLRLPATAGRARRRARTGTARSRPGETLRTDDDATFDHEVVLDAAAIDAVRHLGHQPGAGRCRCPSSVPDPRLVRRRAATGSRRRRALEYMGLTAGHPAARHRRRHRLPRLVHQRADRGPACGRRGDPAAARSPTACGCSSSPARCGCGSPAEQEGLDVVFKEAGAEWRHAGCSMCLGMNPDQLSRRGAQRLDVQPQLRGPSGQGRPHPPGVAARGRGDCRRRSARQSRPTCRPPTARRADMEPVTTHTGRAVALRRSNVDTDQIIPAVYLKRVTRTGFEDGLFAAWRNDPDFVLNRPESAGRHDPGRRVRTSAPARPASTPSGRCRTTASGSCISSRFADIFRGQRGQGRPGRRPACRQPDVERTVGRASRRTRPPR